MTAITLELSLDEVNSVIAVLGDLPTKTGAFPLVMKIKQQAEAQIPKPDPTFGELRSDN